MRVEFDLTSAGKTQREEFETQIEKVVLPEPTEEERLQAELTELQSASTHKQKKEKKKVRAAAAKTQRRMNAGMEANAFDAEHDMELFSLSQSAALLKSSDSASDPGAEWPGPVDENDDDAAEDEEEEEYEEKGVRLAHGDSDGEEEEEAHVLRKLEEELEYDYKRYSAKRKQKDAELKAELADKAVSKKARAALDKHSSQPEEALEMTVDDDRDDEAESLAPADYVDDKKKKKKKKNDEEDRHQKKSSVPSANHMIRKQTSEWFAHPIFTEDTLPTIDAVRGSDERKAGDDELEANEEGRHPPPSLLLPDMPKTEREKRREKRKKQQERAERRMLRRAARDDGKGEEEETLEDPHLASLRSRLKEGRGGGASAQETSTPRMDLEKMKLIQRGMGTMSQGEKKPRGSQNADTSFEIVPQTHPEDEGHIGPAHQARKQDDNEEQDDEKDVDELTQEYLAKGARNKLRVGKQSAESRVTTLALGTLMLNPTRKKNIIDASYNRYAWNESPDDLPSWFLEDENRHSKPQVPVPAALISQVTFPSLTRDYPVSSVNHPDYFLTCCCFSCSCVPTIRSKVGSSSREARKSRRWPRRV
jgi:AdoMet-dependent rRNA methyltransferase SPB1